MTSTGLPRASPQSCRWLARIDPRAGAAGPALGTASAPSPDVPPVAVRAELDGLPIRERTGAPFTATGEAMHACGHDVHMAALVALARAAHGLGEALPAPLLAVFQPSEEAYPSGAQQLTEGPLAALAPAAVVAAHVHPELAWGTVALDPGTVNASCDAGLSGSIRREACACSAITTCASARIGSRPWCG
jgi:metal-dependent amidase/aminoacylase/carboxypeptidase family protein